MHLVIKSSIGFGISRIKGGLVPGKRGNLLLNFSCIVSSKYQKAAIEAFHHIQPKSCLVMRDYYFLKIS